MINRKQIATVANQFIKQGYTASEAFKISWAKYKANKATKVTFRKKDGTETTRNIAPLASLNIKGVGAARSTKQKATVKVVDLDKLEAGLNPFRCIISFNWNQIISFEK